MATEEEKKKERDKMLFIIATVFRAAEKIGGADTTSKTSFNDAEEHLQEAERRGINVADV